MDWSCSHCWQVSSPDTWRPSGHLLRTTERTLLACHSPLPWSTSKRRVCTGLTVRITRDWLTAYNGEILRAMGHHCSIQVCMKSTWDVFWETLDENTLSHCHIIFLSLFPFSLFSLSCSRSLSHARPHTQKKSFDTEFKNCHHFHSWFLRLRVR